MFRNINESAPYDGVGLAEEVSHEALEVTRQVFTTTRLYSGLSPIT